MKDLFVVGFILAIFMAPLVGISMLGADGTHMVAYLLGAFVADQLRAHIPMFNKMRGSDPE
jgi:hypothetical protein